MEVNKYGQVIVTSSEIFDAIYSGKVSDLSNVFLSNNKDIEQFNQSVDINADRISQLKKLEALDIDIKDFDNQNQHQWFMPNNYYPNLIEYLYSCCETEEQTDRVSLELNLFIQHNMMDLLFYLKYLVDTMRANNIVWGVGRGSSVASYVLYLIGIHKIDSIKYNLDINEFLKGEINEA